VRISRQRDGLIRVELLARDPLDTTVNEGPALLSSSDGPVLLGVDDVDSRYRISPVQLGHTVIQGQTRSGKSAFCYWLLSQMASAQDLLIAGSDPTGLLLRPFTGTVHQPWQVIGMDDPDAHVKLLRDLVVEMDARIAAIPPRSDQITPDRDTPLIMVVLEEYAGLLRGVDDSGTGRKSTRVAEVQRLIARLLSEGHKAAIRLLIILQRADAAVLGGFERGQCSVRISFRVDTADAVVMLHPSGRAEAEQHATCPPGLALLSAPGVQLARIRAPYLGDGSDGLYGVYSDLVTARAAR
jgi:S-DNA-T family DNA segregation ATPase FtsK/SpoIIIE